MTDTPDILQRGGSNRGRRVCVVGGGIGGLTAALAFARSGAQVSVIEQAPVLREVGAGIQITPNGARALEALGLGDGLETRGVHAQAVQPVDALTGYPITRFDLTAQSPRYRFFHRATLVSLLGNAIQDAGGALHFGIRVTSVSPQGVLTTTDGPYEADLIVGADGLHSVMRTFAGNIEEATFTGQVAWRGTITAKNMSAVAHIWMAPGRHVVTYPLVEDVLNIVAVQERSTWAEEGWSHRDDPANLQAAFADCAPELRRILSHVKTPYLWGLFRHPVAKHWSSGPLALLGDAAHPTLPFLAQGANLAIEDAIVLARCCDETGPLPDALKRYEAARKPRVARAISAANANARNYHLAGPARRVAHLGLKTLGAVAPRAFINRLDWLYGFDVRSDDAV